MRSRNGFSRRRHPRRWLRAAVLALLLALVLGSMYSCAVQNLVYSASGTVIFIPSNR